MLEALQILLSLAFTVVACYFAIVSEQMVQYKKMRRRMGITDYYDNQIDEEQKG